MVTVRIKVSLALGEHPCVYRAVYVALPVPYGVCYY